MMPHWLVIDLEATTEEGGWPVAEMEVIEIGATLVNQDGRELDHFERFVRPARRPTIVSNWKRNGVSITSTVHCPACRTSISNSVSPRLAICRNRWG
ncbi:hypothetical protein PCPL58_3484 [Pseudomonas cerasi]|uniref:Exonuclease domain-containing protein n=1 Tax=Pseudomonas cerasi TaxID=1583341 RepID=A0A193SSD3_9PSED|nr:hypothetical protein PCPL58_3484 [Pseudomonas cerasi]SOS21661.1 hypothetical protein PL963_03571 [Pseudomonas cerasi]